MSHSERGTTVTQHRRRVTQQDIARLAGVSQATVSLVLNGRDDPRTRIAAQTRERVLQVIIASGYAAGPAARRLAAARDRVIGVLTGEAAFPFDADDFYHPILVGIEERAQRAGGDVLLLTGGNARVNRPAIPGEPTRFHRADGCVLLGRVPGPGDLSALVAGRQPWVAVGRRDDAGSLSYVAADYVTATADLLGRAVALGHRRIAYLGEGDGPESLTDRMAGFRHGVEAAGVSGVHVVPGGRTPGDLLTELRAARATAVLTERHADGAALIAAATGRGLAVPGDLSVVVLGDRYGAPITSNDRAFTGLSVPRRELGEQAAEVLYRLLDGATAPVRRTLDCGYVPGSTLGAAPAGG
jgi:DNA-binding LacI/PurR family transcriptional regulator